MKKLFAILAVMGVLTLGSVQPIICLLYTSFEYRRNEQAKYWMYESINEHLRDSFYNNCLLYTSPDTRRMVAEHCRKQLEDKPARPYVAVAGLLSLIHI